MIGFIKEAFFQLCMFQWGITEHFLGLFSLRLSKNDKHTGLYKVAIIDLRNGNLQNLLQLIMILSSGK